MGGKDDDEAKGGEVEMVLGPSPLDVADSDEDETTDEELSGDEEEEERLTGWPGAQQAMNDFIDSRGCTILMAVVTFYALFGDDCRLAFFPKEADVVFMALSSISFFLFLIELVVNSLGKTMCGRRPPGERAESRGGWKERACGLRGYLFSFFFVLDFVATLSLLPEITWLWGPIIGDDEDAGSTNLAAARAGRVSRAGSKAGRIIRMVRLVRLVKLYMLARRKRKLDGGETVQQSKVGSKLSDLTTRRVIVVVLLMLIVVPVFTYTEEDFSEEYATQYVHKFNVWREAGWDAAPRQLIASFLTWPDSTDPRLVKLQLLPHAGSVSNDLEIDNAAVYDELRTGLAGNELKRVLYNDTQAGVAYSTIAWFDQKTLSQETALFGIALTVFVTILLAAGALQFTADAQRLVLRPIEEMAAFVKRMAENPLTPISSQDNSGQFETNLLENTIKKIGGLLRVGFGQAGAPIIANNLRSSSGGFNPMVEGRKINAIFGFITILQFDDSTEVLQQDVLLFVNNISKVVHDVVMTWGGAPNKNLGEAYLLTWLLDAPEDSLADDPTMAPVGAKRGSMSSMRRRNSVRRTSFMLGDSKTRSRRMSLMSQASTRSGRSASSRRSAAKEDLDLSTLPNAQRSAGQALMAFLKIIGEVSRSKDIIDSPENQLLQKEIRGYYVRLRYGLHVGWGIEGAIGSMHKVDASYLSPHVNIAARMQAAASQYGKALLMSGPFVNLLSDTARRYCRKLDVVAVKGSKVPMPVWTYDVWEWKHVEPSQLMNFESFVQYCTDADVFNTNQQYIPANERRISVLGAAPIIEHPVERAAFDDALFETDQELRAFRAPFTKGFRRRFAMGVELYLSGDWLKARTILEKTLTEPTLPSRDGDGPSRTLLTYMSRFGYQAPKGWAGFRALTSK